MPTSQDDIKKAASQFYEMTKFPKVIGALDCTHIKLQSPGGSDAEIFRNRKGFFSLNVQAISNANLEITDIVTRWPGSAHDSHIFHCSRIHARFESGEFGDYFLLGDGGYSVKPYLMTPLRNPLTEAEKMYNESQIRTRNTVERCFGVILRRFPILSLGIRVALNTSMAIIIACAVLHNICRFLNDEWYDDDDAVEVDEEEIMLTIDVFSNTRNNLILNYFAKL